MNIPKVAVILAGGKGTRLGLKDRPKPMVLIDHRSLIEIQIEWLAGQAITDIYILLNYMPEVFKSELGDGQRWNIRLHFLIEVQPLGTSGALAQLKEIVKGDFFVIYGDLFSAFLNLEMMSTFHYLNKADLTLLTHPNDHPYDSDLVETDFQNRVIGFLTKPHQQDMLYRNLVNAAVYLCSHHALQTLETDVFQDLARDVFPNWINKFRIMSYKTIEYVKDMGTPDRLEKLKNDFLINHRPQKKQLSEKQPCVFWDRDGTLCDYVPHLTNANDFKVKAGAAEVLKHLNQTGVLNIVVTNQPMIAKGLMTTDDLELIHRKLETNLGQERAWLDEIYYCPHHPEKGFPGEVTELKIDCDCRKPKLGLFNQAIKAFNINKNECLLVGDSVRDQKAAHDLGVPFIAVLGGESAESEFTECIFKSASLNEISVFIDQFFKDNRK